MPLFVEMPTAMFDTSQIGRGDLVWAKHYSWDSGRAGFVTTARTDKLIVQYYPGIGNVSNHFIIPVCEVARGDWEIRWSEDLKDIQEYVALADEEEKGEIDGEIPAI